MPLPGEDNASSSLARVDRADVPAQRGRIGARMNRFCRYIAGRRACRVIRPKSDVPRIAAAVAEHAA